MIYNKSNSIFSEIIGIYIRFIYRMYINNVRLYYVKFYNKRMSRN